MSAIFSNLRLVAVLVVGLALAGCATVIPFQSEKEVIVRVADKSDRYPVGKLAGTYASQAILATLAYQETVDTSVFGDQQPRVEKWLVGWHRVPLPKYVCQTGHICAGEVGEQLWIRRNNSKCQQAVVVFRGTVATSFDDWFANLHWFHELTPIEDYYDQARNNIDKVVGIAERNGCAGRIVAIGHSLGGGLAQHVAYANRKIITVYAFDPSFVIGSEDFSLLNRPIYRAGRKFDYIYEHGEILAFLRFIGRQFHPYPACNPRIRTVRFNTLTGSIINQHRIVDFTQKLVALSQTRADPSVKSDSSAPPPNKKYELNAGCPAGT